jgi:sarcosine oxidase delta subunit
VYEFRWGGEVSQRPAPGSPLDVWAGGTGAGGQREWWYYRMGCQRWFQALRDTRTNEVKSTHWPSAQAGS